MAFSTEDLVIPLGSLILVTGANGYIGSHVCDQLLEAGYRVRGTVRNVSKSSWMIPFFDSKFGKGKFELISVPDMSISGGFDTAVKGTSGIAHTAAPIVSSPDPNIGVTSIVNGMLNLLSAASQEPSVERVVVTSSSSAAFGSNAVETDIDENSWFEYAVQLAWAPPPYTPERAGIVYAASKVQSEQAAWKWVRDHQPGFVLNSVIPPINFGKVLSPENQGFPSTAGWIKAAWDGFEAEGSQWLKSLPPIPFVDVQDNARVHVAALVLGDAKGERIFAFAGPFTWNDVLAVFRKIAPERKFIDDLPGLERDRTRVSGRAEELLKRLGRPGWTSLEDSIKNWAEGQKLV